MDIEPGSLKLLSNSRYDEIRRIKLPSRIEVIGELPPTANMPQPDEGEYQSWSDDFGQLVKQALAGYEYGSDICLIMVSSQLRHRGYCSLYDSGTGEMVVWCESCVKAKDGGPSAGIIRTSVGIQALRALYRIVVSEYRYQRAFA